MPLDFPSSPTNGQVYQNYYYDGPTGAWRSLSSTVNPIPSTLKNLTISSSETTGVSLKVTPFTTSSVNLQEWYNTSSNIVASMNVAGDLTVNSLTLTTDLTVANGGTGANSFTSGAYIKGAGSGALTAQVGIPGGDITSGQVGPSFGGTPTGGIMQFAGATAPTGWLLCDGTAVSRTTYANLFTAIGTTYGAGDGSTTFNLPNLKGRVPVGRDAADTSFDVLGETGGAKTHTLTIAEMPSHTHIQDSHRHTITSVYDDANYNQGSIPGDGQQSIPFDAGSIQRTQNTNFTTATNQNTGGGGAHNNLQPYIVMNYIIKT